MVLKEFTYGYVAVKDHHYEDDEDRKNEDISLHAARFLEFSIFCSTSFFHLLSLNTCSLVFLLKFGCLQVLSFDALLLWFKADWYFLN